MAGFGTNLTHAPGSGAVNVAQPGVYLVEFHADAQAPTGTAVPVTASVALNVNGAPVTGAEASHRFTANDAPASLATFAVVSVPSGTATITAVPRRHGHRVLQRLDDRLAHRRDHVDKSAADGRENTRRPPQDTKIQGVNRPAVKTALAGLPTPRLPMGQQSIPRARPFARLARQGTADPRRPQSTHGR